MRKLYYRDVALNLMAKGFSVIPISHGLKYPEGLSWADLPQNEATYKQMLARYGKNAGAGLITCNGLMAIDIDVLDPSIARMLIQRVRGILSTKKIMVRRGRKPKALIPCYTTAAFGKAVSSVYYSEKYGRMQIEILCNSTDGARQFVAYGDYAGEEGLNGLYYEWEDDYSPLNIPDVTALPMFEESMIEPLFKYFDDLMYQNGYERIQHSTLPSLNRGRATDDNLDLINDSKVVKISDDRVREILDTLGEGFNDSYEKWVQVGQALKFQIEDSDKAFKMWQDWSRKASDPLTGKPYDISDKELRAKWKSFKNERTNPITFASVLYDYYNSSKNANFEEVFAQLRQRIDECSDIGGYDALMNEIAYNNFTNEQGNALKQALVKAYKRVYGEKISVSSIEKSLLSRAERFEMPDYMKNWVYLLNGDKFYDVEDRISVSKDGFDSLIYQYADDAMSMKVRPQDLALKAYKIPKVIDAMYMPSMGGIFKLSEYSKYQYVNSYDATNVPEEPSEYSESDLEAIRLVENHFEHMIADPVERNIFRQWVAYQVQYTGKPLGWAVFLHGVGGDGKSFFHYLISAMIGKDNAKIVSQDAMKSGFNKWATNLSVGTVEEVHLVGERGIEIYDKLKTIIASPTIAMIAKGKDEINVPNTTNYLFLSNRLAALPIDNSDRRIFALFSRWQEAKKIEEFKKENPKYYPNLHNTYKYHAGALRKYFTTEVEVTDEFLAYYDAPRTISRLRLVAENMPDAIQELMEIVSKNDDPFLCEDFLDIKYFRQIKQADRSFKDAYIRWQQYLVPLGFELVANAVRIPEIDKSYLHTIYSKRPHLFKQDGVKLSKMIRAYVDNAQVEILEYDDETREVTQAELEDL